MIVEEIMSSARYIAALFVLLSIPTAFVLWAPIHAFSRFWRKLGFWGTYGVLSVPAGGMMAAMWGVREILLRIDFGPTPVSLILSLLCAIGAGLLSMQCRKYLTWNILIGVPELSTRKYPGVLLTDGIYAKIRHPRYVGVSLWLIGCALFANYLTPYILVVAGIPGMYVLALLEERELRKRFGAQYEAYCCRVPRFVPKIFATSNVQAPCSQESAE
jgi:protein-S-isoprenylcysteine O-methyltransferase Ste14